MMAGPYYEIGNDVALLGDGDYGDAYSLGDEEALIGDFMEIGDDAEDLLALSGAAPRRGRGRGRRQLTPLHAMLARNRALLRTRGPTKARTYAMGFRSVGAVAAGANEVMTERPQVPFRGERLFIPSDIAGSFEVVDIKVGKNSQLAANRPLPARMFQEDSVNTPLGLDTAQVSMDVVISVNNISGAPAVFRAGFIGAAVE
jgi:hypothetical protein